MLTEGSLMAAPDLDSLAKEGRQLFRLGKYQESIPIFERVLKHDPDQADVHDAVAMAYFILKQYDLAIEHFNRVAQLQPTNAKVHINIGAVYNRKEEFQKASEVLKKAVAKDGKAVEAYYNLGIAYRGLKQFPMAVNAYKEALRLNPKMLDALQNLGNVLLEMNNPKAAIEQYKKALDLNPKFVRAQRGLERAEEAQGKVAASFNPFGRLVAESPTKQAPIEFRPKNLSPEERLADRQILRRMMVEFQSTGQQMMEHLRDAVIDDVIQLNRGVQQSTKEISKLLFSTQDKFQRSLKKFHELHNDLQKLSNELREHEAEVTIR